MCTPAVMTSNSSLGDPVQSAVWIWIKFSRKSPAVGFTKRHWPLGAFMGTEERKRVAVSSRGLDSVAAEGWRIPPAPLTVTGVVGLKVNTPLVFSSAGAVAAAEEADMITVEMVVGMINGLEAGIVGAGQPVSEDGVVVRLTKGNMGAMLTTPVDDDGAVLAIDVANARSIPAVGVKSTLTEPAKMKAWFGSAGLQGA